MLPKGPQNYTKLAKQKGWEGFDANRLVVSKAFPPNLIKVFKDDKEAPTPLSLQIDNVGARRVAQPISSSQHGGLVGAKEQGDGAGAAAEGRREGRLHA